MDAKVVTIDLRGDVCPYPLIMAIKKISEIKDGLNKGETILKFIIDHPPASRSIPREVEKRGYLSELKKTGGAEWEITVKMKGYKNGNLNGNKVNLCKII